MIMVDFWWRITGRATADLDLIARVLAAKTLDDHGGSVMTLDEAGTVQHLRTSYVRIAVETGLPVQAQQEAARRAWAYIEQAQGDQESDPNARREFSFYE